MDDYERAQWRRHKPGLIIGGILLAASLAYELLKALA